MNSFVKCLRKLKDRELYHLSEAIDLEVQRRFEANKEVVALDLPSAAQGADADLLSMPVARSESGPRRAA